MKTEGRWKCRAMDAEENQKQVSLTAHSPWKSLRDSHIPTAPTSRGKVENQRRVSHFPACCLGLSKTQKGGLVADRFAPASGSFFGEKMLGASELVSVACELSASISK